MTSERPLIGIVAGTSRDSKLMVCNQSYITAIEAAGGCPIVLPHLPAETVPRLLDHVAGLLLTGGGDFDPAYFGQQASPDRLRKIDRPREAFEFELVKAADTRAMPMLGICRGMQWLNVIRGGALHVDLADAGKDADLHARWERPSDELAHTVEIVSGTLLYEIVHADRLDVNSRHHQAVSRLGAHVRPAAVAPDGVVEAIELSDRAFALGAQWHPEDLEAAGESSRRIFNAFIHAAQAQSHPRGDAGGRAVEQLQAGSGSYESQP